MCTLACDCSAPPRTHLRPLPSAEAVRDKKGASGVFVAECKGEVVGLATLIGEVDLGALSALYRLDELLASQHHKAYGHAEVDMVVLSPVFTWRTRHFLRECMRLMGKTCLYYALPKKEPPQEVIADFFQVSTIREPPEISLPPFGLFVHPARLSHHVPARVNSRIVVVGASETGLSAIEGLLTSKEMRFEGITLISPGGNTLGSPLGTSWVDRIALEGSVTVLEGLVTGIDRDQRTVALEDGALVPYDTLVLAAGKQVTCLLYDIPVMRTWAV